MLNVITFARLLPGERQLRIICYTDAVFGPCRKVEKNRWRDLRQENSNNIEAPDIPDSDSTDVALGCCETWTMSAKGKRPRGLPKLRWKDTVRRDLKAWNIREEWATDMEISLHDPLPHTVRPRRKVRRCEKYLDHVDCNVVSKTCG